MEEGEVERGLGGLVSEVHHPQAVLRPANGEPAVVRGTKGHQNKRRSVW
jgi:hypothetical protein